MEYRNAMEKVIKCIPIFLILILGFVMRCELFHATAQDALYAIYPAVYCSIDKSEYEAFQQSLKNLGDRGYGCIVVRKEKESQLENSIRIYTNSINNEYQIKQDSNLSESIYNSLLNGTTKVEFRQIKELTIEDFQLEPYVLLLGDYECTYDDLSKQFEISNPEKMQGEETDMIMIVWGLISVFIILVNIAAVLKTRKIMFIRAVYGENLKKLTIKSFIIDLILYQVLYLSAKTFVFYFLSGDYKGNLAFLIYEFGCFIAASMNFLYLKNNYRAVLSNVQIEKEMLIFLNVLKQLTFAIVIFTLATNISSISTLHFGNKTDELIAEYENNLMISINGAQSESDPFADNLWNTLYEDYFDQLNPKICSIVAEGTNSIIIMNENASCFLPQKLVSLLAKENSEEIIILAPHGYSLPEEDVNGLLGLYKLSDYEWKVCEYDKGVNISCRTNGELTSWTNRINPIIIYCPAAVKLQGSMFATCTGTIYGINEVNWNKICSELGISEKGYHVVISNVAEVYRYQMSFVRRMISFLSSLCILTLILDIAIVISLTKMEFRNSGIEYAIKKVLGYSFIQRNKEQMIKYNIKNIGIILLLSGIGKITGIYNLTTCIAVGVIISILENLVILIYIMKYEKISLIKILKGGCL